MTSPEALQSGVVYVSYLDTKVCCVERSWLVWYGIRILFAVRSIYILHQNSPDISPESNWGPANAAFGVAQWKRGGPITLRSKDRNLPPKFHIFFPF